MHAHVRAQHEVAAEPHQQMFAASVHALDGATGQRRCVIDAREVRKDRAESGDRTAAERLVQRLCRTVNGVPFWHESECSHPGESTYRDANCPPKTTPDPILLVEHVVAV